MVIIALMFFLSYDIFILWILSYDEILEVRKFGKMERVQ